MNNLTLLKEKLEELTGKKILLKEGETSELKAAVAIVYNKDGKVLMGVCKNKDDRFGKLCFPGGGIEQGENPYQAAKREAYEETGVHVKCQPITWLVFEEQPTVAFVLCKFLRGKLKPNEEFDNLDWYDYNEVSEDQWYKNNFNALMHFKK